MKYVIEHLEPELYPWCMLEYTQLSKLVGKKNALFTNLKADKNCKKLLPLGAVSALPVKQLQLKNAVVLDPDAKKRLSASDCKQFEYCILGGILGDYPMQKRTKRELTKKLPYPSRNLGKAQFSTDTAVLVATLIAKGIRLDQIPFQDTIELPMGKYLSLQLPFRYVVNAKGKPILPKGLIELIRKQKF